MSNPQLQSLERALKEYVKEEKRRIENEVSVLEKVLSGRTSGKGVQSIGIAKVSAVAENSLKAYLSGDT
jgi:hypothetical protein